MPSQLRNRQILLDSQALALLEPSASRRSIQVPARTVDSLATTAESVREQLEILTRQRGFIEDSAVIVGEFLAITDPMLRRLDTLELVVEFLLRVEAEKGWLTDSGGLTIGASTISSLLNILQSWDSFTVVSPIYTLMSAIPADGVITIEADGQYKFSGQITYAGSGTNQDYTLGVSYNGAASVDIITNTWTNQIATQTFNWSFIPITPATAGDTIEFTMAAGGSFTSQLSQSMVEFASP